MSAVVWKYELGPLRGQRVEMPMGARLLHVGPNPQTPHVPAVWALVDPAAERETRAFWVVGTGHEIEQLPEGVEHVGSAVCGPYAWHVFSEARALRPSDGGEEQP